MWKTRGKLVSGVILQNGSKNKTGKCVTYVRGLIFYLLKRKEQKMLSQYKGMRKRAHFLFAKFGSKFSRSCGHVGKKEEDTDISEK